MRTSLPAALWAAATLAVASPALALSARDHGPTLTLPDGSVLPLPPGTHAFGPDGPLLPPDDAEPAPGAPPRSAGPPDPSPPVAEAPRTPAQRLDELYERLAQAKDAPEARAIEARIGAMGMRSGSDTADLLMGRATTAMGTKDYATAGALLDRLVALRPGWAEAWNRRATLRFLADDDAGSMADIGQVLHLEPRHVGALSGMGMILHRNGNNKGALAVLRRAQAIDPQDAQLKQMIDDLAPAVEGQEL